eukprot:6209882-Pleurochrysis_carterae.AAC.3
MDDFAANDARVHTLQCARNTRSVAVGEVLSQATSKIRAQCWVLVLIVLWKLSSKSVCNPTALPCERTCVDFHSLARIASVLPRTSTYAPAHPQVISVEKRMRTRVCSNTLADASRTYACAIAHIHALNSMKERMHQIHV